MVAETKLPNVGDPPTAVPLSPDSGQVSQAAKRKRTWVGFFRDVFVYLIGYIVVSGITIGPFFWQWFGSMYADGPRWVAHVYSPLAYLCEICSPLRWVINEWINWWIL